MQAWARTRLQARDDAGVSLVEVLMALVILSIAAVAILAGLQLSITTSDIQRKQTTGGTYVRNYAEAIEATVLSGGWQAGCATGAASAYAPGTVSYAPPTGFTAAVTQVQALRGDGSADPACPTTGIQRVTVSVSSGDARATEYLTLVVRKP